MTRYSIDVEGVSHERGALAHDPVELRECASAVAVATAGALGALGEEGARVQAALGRFRRVHAHALDAVADAAAALAGRLDGSAAGARAVELSVTASLADVSASTVCLTDDSPSAGRP